MPELPEVETICRGIAPYLTGQHITHVTIRQSQLRWPVPLDLNAQLAGARIAQVARRGKYLLLTSEKSKKGKKNKSGHLIIHLGMSGRLWLVAKGQPAAKHDHCDFHLTNDYWLRYHDPRRFGAILWTQQDPQLHPLLAHLGPEPLTDEFSADYLYTRGKDRNQPIKTFIMDSKVVVGVGNIYANEALYQAGIRPDRMAKSIAKGRYQRLAKAIKAVLAQAIAQGGTTLKDFVGADGQPGYFQQSLAVYGRAGEPCLACSRPVKQIKLAQRSTYYCSYCQR
jgi:formamidopyrimidine-DNA glycosylase